MVIFVISNVSFLFGGAWVFIVQRRRAGSDFKFPFVPYIVFISLFLFAEALASTMSRELPLSYGVALGASAAAVLGLSNSCTFAERNGIPTIIALAIVHLSFFAST